MEIWQMGNGHVPRLMYMYIQILHTDIRMHVAPRSCHPVPECRLISMLQLVCGDITVFGSWFIPRATTSFCTFIYLVLDILFHTSPITSPI